MAPVEGNINSLKYQEFLEEYLWAVFARHFPRNGYFLQDDNAPVHRSRSAQEYMVRNHISRSAAVKSKADLIEEIRLIWTGITPAYIQSMYGSIPKRIQQVIRLKGTSQSIKL